MGRTVLDGRGGGPSRRDRQAIEWPPRPGGTVGGAPPGRPGGGRDSSGISGLTAIVIVFLALLLIGGAAYVVYSVYTGLGGIQGLVRGSVSQLDTPVSDDSRKVTFTVQPAIVTRLEKLDAEAAVAVGGGGDAFVVWKTYAGVYAARRPAGTRP